jgi:hypothetical protein
MLIGLKTLLPSKNSWIRFWKERLKWLHPNFTSTVHIRILTSCKFYLIHMSWVPCMTLTPLLTDSSPPSERQFRHSPKIEYSVIFYCHSGYRQCENFLIFRVQKLVSAAAKPLWSVLPLSRWVFSAQDGAAQKLKICPEPSAHFLNLFLKILYHVCSPNGNVFLTQGIVYSLNSAML